MRIKEWYAFHYPELAKHVPGLYEYVRCASAIMDRKNFNEEVEEKLKGNFHKFAIFFKCYKFLEILNNEEKVAVVVESARTSMGMDISELDLLNIERFAVRVASLSEYRQRLHEYIKNRMESCAPSLSALIGEQVFFK